MKFRILPMFFLVGLSCKPRSDSSLQSESIASSTGDLESVTRFRNFFLAAAKDQVGENTQHLSHLIYLPTNAELNMPNEQVDADPFFKNIRQKYSSDKVSDYFQAATKAGTASPKGHDLNHALRRLAIQTGEPLTIILVPGVFGELIKPRAFEEVFARSDGAFNKLWSNTAARTTYDASNGLQISLDQLISVGSITDPDNSRSDLARVILFNTPKLSFESLRKIEDASRLFSRRLKKTFDLIGTPKNIVFIGYSRGAPVALDMLANAAKHKADWLPNVRAMISLAGVIYGSDLADSIDKPGHLNHQLFLELKTLMQKLDSDASRWANASSRPGIILANATAYARFAGAASKAAVADTFKADWSTARLLAEVKKLRDNLAAQSRVDAGPSLELIHLLMNHFGLLSPDLFGDAYPKNVAAFKDALQAVIDAIDGLKTSSRLQWWRNHTIPSSGIRYLSLATTMSDDPALAYSRFTTNPGSVDDLMLMDSYSNFNKLVAVRINDSQVAIDKARFWPQTSHSLNSAQQSYDARFLGVLGTHHWGLALPYANAQKDGSINPFPRLALLKALSSYVAHDLGFRVE
jgi:hypothetical protein